VAAPSAPAAPPDLARVIGLGPATLLVMGNVLGSAIFLTTGLMAEQLPSVPLLLAAWGLGGVVALAGALTCAELGAMFPRSGGWYVFLREAYGPVWGFLFGWAGLLVMLTGSLAAVAVGFAEYASYFVPAWSTTRVIVALPLGPVTWTISAGQIVAVASLALIAAANVVGVRTGLTLQSVLTVVKIGLVVAVPVLALWVQRVTPDYAALMSPLARPGAAFGVAMIAVMWAYSGWDYLAFAAGEVRDPGRTIPRALVLGTSGLTVLYLLINVGYMYSLRIEEMQGVARIAELSVSALVGTAGAGLVALGVMVSTFGCNAASVLPTSRVCYAMSADGLLIERAAAVHPKYRTPHVAILLTCGWASLLALSGTYEQLFTYVTFTALLFNVAGGLAIFRLRRTRPDAPRPYRAWGYPVTPAIFVAATGVLLVNTLIERPWESFVGLGLVGMGLLYYWYKHA
jgi:APA family basic amino acid/polyamine antiporter